MTGTASSSPSRYYSKKAFILSLDFFTLPAAKSDVSVALRKEAVIGKAEPWRRLFRDT